MNLPTLTDKQRDAFTARIDPNGGTAEDLADQLIIAQAQKWADEDDAIMRANLATNERLVALGAAVAAQPDKIDAVEAAVTTVLQSQRHEAGRNSQGRN